jgi:hypothetical protein
LLLGALALLPFDVYVVDDASKELHAAGTPIWTHLGDLAVAHGQTGHRAIEVAAVLAAVVVVAGYFGVSSFRANQREKAAAAEARRVAQAAKASADAAESLEKASREIDAIARVIPSIDTEAARASALSRCDGVSSELSIVARLDPANSELPARTGALEKLKERIRARVVPSGEMPPVDDSAARLAAIREELVAAGNAPSAPISAVEDALRRADHGIELAKDFLRTSPADRQARTLLADLQQARTILVRRHDGLVGQAKPPTPPTPPKAVAKVEPKPEAKPEEIPAPKGVDAAKTRESVEQLQGEASRQALTSASGAAGRAALARQALDALSQAGGQDWARSKRSELQVDLDTALVWTLFYKFQTALVAKDTAAILALYPKYPSAKGIAELRAFKYNFEILDLSLAAKTVSVRESTHSHHYPNYWDPPHTAVLKYTLEQRGDGSWTIASGTLAP